MPGRDTAGSVALEEIPDVADLMGDADAAGEEEDGTVGVEGLETAVRALEGAAETEHATGGGGCAGVEGVRHAGAFGHDHGEGGGGAGGEGVFEIEIFDAGGEFFVFEREVGRGAGVGPGDGEGVGHPERDGGDVGVGVGAGAVAPGADELEGDAAGFAGKGFDGDHCRAAEGDVVVEEPEEAEGAVVGPEHDDGDHVGHLRQGADLGVFVDAEDDEEGEELVEVQESFVEGVADGRGCLEEDDDHGDGAEEAVLDEGVGAEGVADARPAFDVHFVGSPGTGVDDGFQNDDSTDPSMEEVEGVERDAEDLD